MFRREAESCVQIMAKAESANTAEEYAEIIRSLI